MTYTVTLIPGDGIGPEVAARGRARARGHRRRLRVGDRDGRRRRHRPRGHGAAAAQSLDSIRTQQGGAQGAHGHARSAPATARSTWRCARRSTSTPTCARWQTLPGVKSRYEDVDLVVVRENTEDLYSGLEHIVVPGVVESIKIITEKASTRIAQLRLRVRAHARPQAGHRRAQGQHHEALGRPLPRLLPRRSPQGFPEVAVRRDHRGQLPACSWCWTPRASTCCCSRTSTATSSPTSAPASSAAWAWSPAPTSARTARSSRPCTARAPDIAGKNLANPIALHALGGDDARPPGRARRGRSRARARSTRVLARGPEAHPRPGRHRRAPRRSRRRSPPTSNARAEIAGREPLGSRDRGAALGPVRLIADQMFSRASGARLREGNRVRLLKDAAENYPAWLDAIARRPPDDPPRDVHHPRGRAGPPLRGRPDREGARGREGARALRLDGRARQDVARVLEPPARRRRRGALLQPAALRQPASAG